MCPQVFLHLFMCDIYVSVYSNESVTLHRSASWESRSKDTFQLIPTIAAFIHTERPWWYKLKLVKRAQEVRRRVSREPRFIVRLDLSYRWCDPFKRDPAVSLSGTRRRDRFVIQSSNWLIWGYNVQSLFELLTRKIVEAALSTRQFISTEDLNSFYN